MFELECNRGQGDFTIKIKQENIELKQTTSPLPGTKNVLLKGQMKFLEDINAVIFLCSPV